MYATSLSAQPYLLGLIPLVSEPRLNEVIQAILLILAASSPVTVLLIILLLYPEKIEKLSALIWKCIYRLKLLGTYARKTYIKHDLQSHVNDFVRRTTKDVPGLHAKGVRIEWEKPGDTTRESFLRDGEVIIRLSHKKSEAENVATALYWFVSKSLLPRAKRYISPSQGQATDLFVMTKLLQQQKPDVVDCFLETYLHPGLREKKGKPLELYDKFEQIDRVGLFFPVFLREVDHLGQKVFGKPLKDQIIIEINDLINHLTKFSQRVVGEEMDLNFQKNYCKFGLMIVGKSVVVTASVTPYVSYIRDHVVPSNIETLYMIGHLDNVEAIRRVAAEVRDSFDEIASHKFKGQIHPEVGKTETVESYLLVLRAKDRPLVTRGS